MSKNTQKNPITVWEFYDAPEWMQKLSPHGGDEDWVAQVPAYFKDRYLGWLATGTPFGVCDVSEHPQDDGSTIYIGAHA